MLLAIALGLPMQFDRAASFPCGIPLRHARTANASRPFWELDGQTARIQGSAGLVVVLVAYSQDIQPINQGDHLCLTRYRSVVSGDKVIQSFFHNGNLAEWDRSVSIRVDGFSPDGKLAYILEAEGGELPVLKAEEIDLTKGERRRGELNASFIRSISPECSTTLHFAGLSSDNSFVLATSQDDGCPVAQFWKLSPINIAELSKRNKRNDPYIAFEPPVRLESLEGVRALDPGKVLSR